MAAAGAATAAAAGIGAATTTQSPPTTPPTTPTVQPHIGQAPPVVHHPQMVAIPNPQAMAAAAAGIAAVLNNPAANPLQHHYLQFQNPNIIHLLQGFRPPQGPAPDQP